MDVSSVVILYYCISTLSPDMSEESDSSSTSNVLFSVIDDYKQMNKEIRKTLFYSHIV